MPRFPETIRAAQIHAAARTGMIPDGAKGVVTGGVVIIVVAGVVMTVGGVVVGVGEGIGYSSRTNVVVAVASWIRAETVTIYSSGFQAEVSTGNDQRFMPVPVCT